MYYAYVVTSVDANGEESNPSIPATGNFTADLRTSPGTNTISWDAVAGAQSRSNVYKADGFPINLLYRLGSSYGFIGNVTGLSIKDSNIAEDYS